MDWLIALRVDLPTALERPLSEEDIETRAPCGTT